MKKHTISSGLPIKKWVVTGTSILSREMLLRIVLTNEMVEEIVPGGLEGGNPKPEIKSAPVSETFMMDSILKRGMRPQKRTN